jgi:hypothetical protein
MEKLPTTIEALAAMMNQGFTETQQHMDAQLAALKGEMMMGIMKDMAEELTATHEDVRYVRTTMTMLARSDAAIESLRKRVKRVERKVGIAK